MCIYVHMFIYAYNSLLHIYCVCIMLHKRKQRLCQDHQTSTLITHCVLQHCTKRLACMQTYIFENGLFPPAAVQQKQHVDAVGCRTFSSRLIRMPVFDILQIPSGCIQICSGYVSPNFNPHPSPGYGPGQSA
jgi:hypothetical protein